jgi:ATP-dependent Clp protease ATP-binding subunit ClpA
MFERFTDRARSAVALAQEEARLLSHNYVGTEHVLLGLLHEGGGIAARALASLGISLEVVRAQVEDVIGRGQTAPAAGHIPFTPRAKKVLELALREAVRLGHNYIGTEHVLLGLVREGEGVASQVLARLGAGEAAVRGRVEALLADGGHEAEAAARTRWVRMTVPADLRELEERLAETRRRKQAAIDAEDFATAAVLRDTEKQLWARLTEREREWTAGVDLEAVIADNHRLHRELDRLRALLREHGIEPDGGTARTA